ncbi:MAG: hypothetical protein R8G66_01405 [Cytophagales bacterium]|nr:hypothetical protein [Cytophagales bacterium]
MSKLEEILTKIGDKIADATILQIDTVMATLDVGADGKIATTPGTDIEGMTSSINLIDGDITNTIAPGFYQKYPDLIKFHETQVEKGSAIVKANMEALKSIVSVVESLGSDNTPKE